MIADNVPESLNSRNDMHIMVTRFLFDSSLTTDRSKAVVLVFLLRVALWFLLRGVSC